MGKVVQNIRASENGPKASDDASPAQDSLRKRYVYKLITNLVGLFIGLVTQAIIPRGLGPKAYGDFNFLTNFFNEILAFLDMGTSIGFYTKLSSRPREFGIVAFYGYFSVIIFLGIIVFVAATTITSTHSRLWPDQQVFYIYLAAVWGILNWGVMVLNKMADAYGVTVSTEIVRVSQKALGLLLIILLYATQTLNLTTFFGYHYLLFIVLAAAFVWVMERSGYSLRRGWRLTRERVRGYGREFYHYSHPLFVYAVVGLIVGVLDRWLLQFFGGSIQQGFYGLSYQIGAICFLFTSAMTPLLTREFSLAFSDRDLTRMAALFRRYVPLLYAIAAYFSCFIAMQAERVVYIMGGKGYAGAATAVFIMSFYPIHQTYGQLSGSVFYATGQTALYRNIGVVFMLLGLPVTYFLIMPAEYFGLNLGGTGLAVKMVALQFVWVNVQLYYNARMLRLSFPRYLGHQLFSVGSLLAAARLADAGTGGIALLRQNVIAGFLVSGVLYTLMVAGMGYAFPALFGLGREDIRSLLESFAGRMERFTRR